MPVSRLMSIGVRALMAQNASLQTVGHNIANASTEGYSRQRAELATAQSQYSGAGYFGGGVNVETVTRTHNQYLTREASSTKSLAARDAVRQQALQDLENVFPPGESGIGYTAAQFLNSAVDVASHPNDIPTRQVMLARADELAGRFADSGRQIDTLKLNNIEALKNNVSEINGLTRSIAAINQRIASVNGLGQPPNDLLDQRDQLVSRLSEIVQVTTLPANDGTLSVFVAGGQRVVLGTEPSELKVVDDPTDPSRAAIAIEDGASWRTLQAEHFGGGEIAGRLMFQNTDLVAAEARLGQMAAAIAGAVNRQQSLGWDLKDPPGAGSAIFSVGAPQALPAQTNARDAVGNFVSSVGLQVIDAGQLQATEYELRSNAGGPAGSWQLTRKSDGLVRVVVDGDTVDGFQINLGTPQPAATDRFTLQPVARAAVDMKVVLDDVNGIAAAAPLTATKPATNTGTASVASLTMVSTAVNPALNAQIQFTNATGAYSWTLRDAATNAVTASGTGTWSAGQPITVNGAELRLNGVPANGDRFDVVKTAFPKSNNGNALALVALRDSPIVGRTLQPNGQVGGGHTVTDAYASAMGDVGVNVQLAATAAKISGGLATRAETARASASGVNLDEEAAQLIAHQQAYQAAAKVLQVAQTVFDTLLQATSSR